MSGEDETRNANNFQNLEKYLIFRYINIMHSSPWKYDLLATCRPLCNLSQSISCFSGWQSGLAAQCPEHIMLTNGPLHCPGLSPPPPAAVFTSSKPIIIAPEAELCSCDNTGGSGFHLHASGLRWYDYWSDKNNWEFERNDRFHIVKWSINKLRINCNVKVCPFTAEWTISCRMITGGNCLF